MPNDFHSNSIVFKMEQRPDHQTVIADADEPTSSERGHSHLIEKTGPVECTDGSLVIDANNHVTMATPEQQQLAMKAREATKRAREKS